jgi:DNA polymerase-3 subunit epsilon
VKQTVGSAKSQPRLADDAAFRETHFILLDFEGTTPKGFPPEPIEVAALGVQHEPGRGPAISGFLVPIPDSEAEHVAGAWNSIPG